MRRQHRFDRIGSDQRNKTSATGSRIPTQPRNYMPSLGDPSDPMLDLHDSCGSVTMCGPAAAYGTAYCVCVWFALGVVVFCGEVMPLEPSPPWMVRRYGLPILHAVPRRRLNASPCLTRPWRSVFSSKVIKHIRFFKIFLLVLLVFFSPVYASRTSPLSHMAVAVFNSRTALAKIFSYSPLVLLIAGASEVRPIVWRPS